MINNQVSDTNCIGQKSKMTSTSGHAYITLWQAMLSYNVIYIYF
jgi:hypothetical protein